jgi:hypothetical protein
VPLKQARRALHWRYAHLPWSRAGIVHRMLDAYAEAHESTNIGFEDWVRTAYDPVTLSEGAR